MSYTQLSQGQRYQISALLKMGHNQMEISKVIGKHKSTVSRELERNYGLRGYRPKQAHHKALCHRNHSYFCILPETWELIETKLHLDWSPEQISGWLQRLYASQVSHEWIYPYILVDKQAGWDLYRHFRCQKKRRKRYGSYDRRGKLPNRVSIEERPAIFEQRQQIECKSAVEDWKEHGLVFTTRRGTPIHQRNLLRSFKDLLKQAGLPQVRFHDLSHSNPSIIINHGVPVIIVSRRLGHARTSITMDVFGHLLPSMQDEVA
jgi:IS30 family transposase